MGGFEWSVFRIAQCSVAFIPLSSRKWKSRGKWNYSYYWPMCDHHLWALDICFYISDKFWLLVQSPISRPQSGEKHPEASWSFGCRRLCFCSDAFAIDFLNFQCNVGLVFLRTWENTLESVNISVCSRIWTSRQTLHIHSHSSKHTQAENNTFTPLRSQAQQGFNAWTALS